MSSSSAVVSGSIAHRHRRLPGRLPWRRCPPRWSTGCAPRTTRRSPRCCGCAPTSPCRPPADLTVLATRAGVRASVHRACDDLDTRHAGRAGGRSSSPTPTPRPSPVPSCAGCSARTCPPTALSAALAALRARALVWGAGRRPLARPGRARRGAAPPGRPGRPGLRAGRVVRAAGAARRRRRPTSAGCSTRSPPARRSGAAGRAPTRTARSAGCSPAVCCCASTPRPSSCPGRSGSHCAATARWARSPSRRRTSGRGTGAQTSSTARPAARRSRCCARLELLIAFWSHTPPPVLRSGGLGVRELRRAAREMDTDETTAALLVELAVGADLVAETDGVAPDWVPTTTADVWAAGGPELRWSTARPHLAGPAPAARSGRPQGRRRPSDLRAVRRGPPPARAARPPPGAGRARRAAARHRARVRRRAGRPAGLAGPPARRTAARRGGRLGARRGHRAGCRRPRRALRARAGRCSTTRTGSWPLCGRRCPNRSTTCCCRPTSPRWLPARWRPSSPRELDLVADVESAGGATVYRFTEATIRRALDAGRVGRRPARAARDALGHPGAAGPDLPRRRRGAPARAAARRRRGVVPALRRRGADRRGARPPGHRRAGAAPHRPDRGSSPRCRSSSCWTGLRAAGFSPGRRGHRRRGARPDRPRPPHVTSSPRRGPQRAAPRAGRRAARRAGVPDAGR